jgi:hypothetical protein
MTAPLNYAFDTNSAVAIGTASVGMLTEFHHANQRASTKTSGVGVTAKTFRGGRNNQTLTVGFLGSKCPAPGTVLALAAALTDGGSYSYPAVGLTQVRVSGRKDGTIEGSLTGRPAPASLVTTVSEAEITDVSFNGSTCSFTPSGGSEVTFGGAPRSLNSMTYEGTCAESENTGAGDTDVVVTPGIPDETVTLEVEGSKTLTEGSVGPLVCDWNDGGTLGTWDFAELISAKDGGNEDGDITTEYTFKRRKSATA